jgi:predicted site-specific integrase-resolvase
MAAKRASQETESRRVFGQGPGRRKIAFRAGLYVRVSTHDQRTLPLQNRALREYAARRGWIVAMQVKEVGSGAAQREAREKLLEAALEGSIVNRGFKSTHDPLLADADPHLSPNHQDKTAEHPSVLHVARVS